MISCGGRRGVRLAGLPDDARSGNFAVLPAQNQTVVDKIAKIPAGISEK